MKLDQNQSQKVIKRAQRIFRKTKKKVSKRQIKRKIKKIRKEEIKNKYSMTK